MTEAEAIREIKEHLAIAGCEDLMCSVASLDLAIKALESIEKIKYIINEKHYPDAEECDYGQYYHCENALMIADIEDVLTELEDSEV